MSPFSRFAGLIAAGVGAAFAALLAGPLARADINGTLGVLDGDAYAFSNSFGPYEALLFDSDLSQNLVAAGINDLADHFPSGATASQDLSAVVTEGNTITGQLDALEGFQPAGVAATTDSKELPVIGDMLALQEQINNAITNLPAITTQDEANPLLIADLSALYDNELNLSTYATNLGYELAAGSPAGLTGDNTNFVADGLGIVTDLHATADTLTLLAELSSLGL